MTTLREGRLDRGLDARRIGDRRRKLRLTLKDVAGRVAAAGQPCSVTTAWRWEVMNGTGRPVPRRAWGALAMALRCSVAELRAEAP
jgi:hypothetical protein